MSATYNLFIRWKAKKGYKSDRQAALALGISAQAVHIWKEGRNGDAEYIIKMANDLGENPTKTVLEAYAEKEKGESARGLMKLSKQFGVVVLMFLGIFSAIAPRTAQARSGDYFAENGSYVYYVKVKLALGRILAILRALTWHTKISPHHPAFRQA